MLEEDREFVLAKHPLAVLEVQRTAGGIRSFCIKVPGYDTVAQNRLVRSFTVWRITEQAAWKEAALRVRAEEPKEAKDE